jgi:hypothetical protein
VVELYGWEEAARGHMKLLRACALKYPRFREDFCLRLNFVLLERHCQAIRSGRGRTLGEVRLQPHIDYVMERMDSIPMNQALLNAWLASRDGAVPIDSKGTLLKDCRAEHFSMYLLEVDQFGMLKAKSTGEIHPPPSIPPLLADTPLDPVSEVTTPGGIMSATPAIYNEQDQTGPWISFGDYTIGPQTDPSKVNSWLSPEMDGNMEVPFASSIDHGLLLQDNPNLAMFSDVDCAEVPNYGHLGESLGLSYNELPTLLEDGSIDMGLGTTWVADAEYQQQSVLSAHVELLSPRSSNARDASNLSASSTLTELSQNDRVSQTCRLTIDDPYLADGANQYLETTLHNKHQELLLAYLEVLSRTTAMETIGSQRWIRGQWLTSKTEWAKVWTPPESDLPSGTASSECDAEILYYTSHEFLRDSQGGKRFLKPVVIKERFSDVGMHTCCGFAAILRDTTRNSKIEVASLDSESTENMELQTFVALLQASGGSDLGLSAQSSRDIAKSHRPLFTLLPRYRLLECLTERMHPGKQMSPVAAISEDTVNFNVVSLPGSFAGAQVNALGGTWIRNLQGIKFWMIIPEEEMRSEWAAFAESGDKWLPSGRERLVVLEEDDVIFVPSGLLAVHAVHHPTTSLMQGALFWDELTLTPTLQAIHWIKSHQRFETKSSHCQLSVLGEGLEQLAAEQPHRFSSESRPASDENLSMAFC